MTTNPVHLYRSLLREATYLPLPQCRTFVKDHITASFRRYLPKYANSDAPKSRSGNPITFERQTKLLHRGRKFLSSLRRANEGYTAHVEKVLRMTYGRVGPRRYALLEPWLQVPAASLDDTAQEDLRQPSESKSGSSPGTGTETETKTGTAHHRGESGASNSKQEKKGNLKTQAHAQAQAQAKATTPKAADKAAEELSIATPLSPRRQAYFSSQLAKYNISPNMRALLVSQATEQSKFDRANRPAGKIRPTFKPPQTTTIWGAPLPPSRVKNLKREWYHANLAAALPPLPQAEYNAVHDLVSGKAQFPPVPRRRPRARRSEADRGREEADRQSVVILEGPRPGVRFKDYTHGRPHKMTPRLLRHLLSRAVLKQTPFVVKATTDPGRTRTVTVSDLAFHWDDALTRERYQTTKLTSSITRRQCDLLFGT
ncbi:hypothetical protein PV08_06895 [Exophiala spinifera]|uniref:LYR motif-containing protein Cup1-like N-terminal domain-containing protein n=1 Tax=Exophiala spinifera TaxID=91928 RepID=A0A0D2BSB6_9EURO|nr:uncharacterized protein PV08_06895 [Exophiala spinifera]KIW14114.1 hypothetical protein PV08_06895 [Exophiala spinifera]